MHALLLTVLTLTAQPGTVRTPAAQTREVQPVQYESGDCYSGEGYSEGYSEGYVGGDYGGGYTEGGMWGRVGRKKGPMPQTCYAPRYGCYPGNDRYVHRYPAFHDSYYRRPYAYRNCFEYPWHAELHEPTSLWSYNVPMEEEYYEENPDVPVPPPSVMAPESSARRGNPDRLGEATREARVIQQGLTEELAPTPALRKGEIESHRGDHGQRETSYR